MGEALTTEYLLHQLKKGWHLRAGHKITKRQRDHTAEYACACGSVWVRRTPNNGYSE